MLIPEDRIELMRCGRLATLAHRAGAQNFFGRGVGGILKANRTTDWASRSDAARKRVLHQLHLGDPPAALPRVDAMSSGLQNHTLRPSGRKP